MYMYMYVCDNATRCMNASGCGGCYLIGCVHYTVSSQYLTCEGGEGGRGEERGREGGREGVRGREGGREGIVSRLVYTHTHTHTDRG